MPPLRYKYACILKSYKLFSSITSIFLYCKNYMKSSQKNRERIKKISIISFFRNYDLSYMEFEVFGNLTLFSLNYKDCTVFKYNK